MEEPPVEAAVLQLAHRAGVAVRQDRLRAVGRRGDRLEPRRDGANRLVPADALELPLALAADALQRVEQPVRVVDAVEVVATFWQRKPRVKGWSWSPRSSTARPSRSTVTTMPQVSGQSCGQTAFTVVSSRPHSDFPRRVVSRYDNSSRIARSVGERFEEQSIRLAPSGSSARAEFSGKIRTALLLRRPHREIIRHHPGTRPTRPSATADRSSRGPYRSDRDEDSTCRHPQPCPSSSTWSARAGWSRTTKLDEVARPAPRRRHLPQTDRPGRRRCSSATALLTFFQAKQLKLGRYKRFTIGSKYRLLELIGAGGMGAVYLCEHTLMQRLVALKVLPVEKLDDQSNLERFYREARAVAALDHPNIVRAYDIDQYEKLHFLVMEYVDGHEPSGDRRPLRLEKKPFDPIRAAHYIAQAAVGMQHAHELGMVHRDIKPGNLLLDRTGVIKVLDMGLARFFNKQQDSVTEKYDDKCVLGTADYLAPEQAVSNMVDIRADIYALGGTLYFMLTGQTPFPDGTIAAKLVAHQTREPQPVESFRSDVPPGMLAVLRKMMAKEPADRYQEPIEVAEALAEWADTPIAPPPEREMPDPLPAGAGAGRADRAAAPARRWPACCSARAAGCSRGRDRQPGARKCISGAVERRLARAPSPSAPGRARIRATRLAASRAGPVSTARAAQLPPHLCRREPALPAVARHHGHRAGAAGVSTQNRVGLCTSSSAILLGAALRRRRGRRLLCR